MSLGNVVGFVTRLLDDHGHSGSELPAMPGVLRNFDLELAANRTLRELVGF